MKAVEEGQAPESVVQTYRVSLKTVKSYVAKKADGTLYPVRGSGGRLRLVQEHNEMQLLKQINGLCCLNWRHGRRAAGVA